jgi:hypothetical protein
VSYRVIYERERVRRTKASRLRRTANQKERVQKETQTPEDDGQRRIEKNLQQKQIKNESKPFLNLFIGGSFFLLLFEKRGIR